MQMALPYSLSSTYLSSHHDCPYIGVRLETFFIILPPSWFWDTLIIDSISASQPLRIIRC